MLRILALGLALGAGTLAKPATADFCLFCAPATHYVGKVLPGGYVITQFYGANRFLATRNGSLYYVQGSKVSYLDPRYSIGAQIDQLDDRRRFLRD